MKRSISFLALLLVALPLAFAQQYGWKDISSNVPEYEGYSYPRAFTDVFFINNEEGWITTVSGISDSSYILHTTDGGETFEMQKTQFGCEAVHMLNENEGYAGGYQGRVYRTTDGGENWIAIGSIGNTLSDITFPPDGDTGYACGLNGTIAYIDSAGVHTMVSGFYASADGLSFPVTSDEGWVVAGDVIRHYKNNQWNGDQDYPSGYYYGIQMFNNMNGWAIGHAIIIQTTDGVNWTKNLDPLGGLWDLHFVNANEGWVVGEGPGGIGKILHTSDGGQSWEEEAEELEDNRLIAVHFTSSTNGYAVGLNNSVLKYTEVSGIDENSNSFEFYLFPNPADESVRIKCSEFNTEAGNIEILSPEGRTLQKRTVSKGNEAIELDLKGMAAGIYMCRITIGNKTSSRKLIIE